MYAVSSFQNTIAGVVFRTTHLYHRGMTFDKIIDLVVMASRKGKPTDDGFIRYEYTAHTRLTNPYRVLLCRIHHLPGKWLTVTDFPVGIHPGLMTVEYENPYLIKSELLHVEPTTGAIYTIEKPEGY